MFKHLWSHTVTRFIYALCDVTDLVVFSVGLSVPSWAGRDRQTLPSFLLLKQVLKPGRTKSNEIRLKYELRETLNNCSNTYIQVWL